MGIYLNMLFFALSFYGINKMVYNKTIEKILLFIMFFMLFIVSAIRKYVGTDYGIYLHVYNGIENRVYDREGMEIGYFYLNKLTKYLFGGEYTIFIITSLIIIGLIYLTIKKNSIDPLMSMIIFMCLGFYITSFNTIRQYIAIALIFYSIRYCETKIKWIIPILIASLFHTTALIVIPFYFISKLNLSKKQYLVLLSLGPILYLSYGRTVIYLTNFLERFQHYQNSRFVTQGANPIRTIITISILVFCFISYDEIIKNKKMKFALGMVIFGTLFSVLMIHGKIFARIVDYFNIFQVILIPYVIKNMNRYKMKKYSIFITIAIICWSSFYFYYSIRTNQADVMPYRTYMN